MKQMNGGRYSSALCLHNTTTRLERLDCVGLGENRVFVVVALYCHTIHYGLIRSDLIEEALLNLPKGAKTGL